MWPWSGALKCSQASIILKKCADIVRLTLLHGAHEGWMEYGTAIHLYLCRSGWGLEPCGFSQGKRDSLHHGLIEATHSLPWMLCLSVRGQMRWLQDTLQTPFVICQGHHGSSRASRAECCYYQGVHIQKNQVCTLSRQPLSMCRTSC